MDKRLIVAATAAAVFSMVGGCANTPNDNGSDATGNAAPVVHEYRTGSLMVEKTKHVTTDEERQQAQDMADKIRASGGMSRSGN